MSGNTENEYARYVGLTRIKPNFEIAGMQVCLTSLYIRTFHDRNL